jgi:hypothetical protein
MDLGPGLVSPTGLCRGRACRPEPKQVKYVITSSRSREFSPEKAQKIGIDRWFIMELPGALGNNEEGMKWQ